MDSGNGSNTNQRKSYQLRALARSKLSYQKRQYKVNICCVAICPLMMVAIGGIIGILIKNLVAKSFPKTDFLMCSNQNASDAFNLPLSRNNINLLPTVDPSTIPHSSSSKTYYATNFYLLPFTISDSTGQSRPYTLADTQPSCVWAYDKNYNFSNPYLVNPNVSLSARLDATNKPDPLGGWLNTNFMRANPLRLLLNQQIPWMIVKDPSSNAGFRNKINPITMTPSDFSPSSLISGSAIQDFLSSNSTKSIISNNQGSGFLNQANTNFFLNINPSNSSATYSFLPVPWFQQSASSTSSPADLDDELATYIRATLKGFESIDPSVFNAKSGNASDSDSLNALLYYFGNTSSISSQMPWGALYFNNADSASRNWDYILQVGENLQISNAGNVPSIIERMFTQQTILGNSFLRDSLKKTEASIVHLLRAMPQVFVYEFTIPIGSLIGSSLYPFGVSFLISIFVLILVKEKEERILVMMQMNGLKYSYYYISHYIHFFILTVWSSIFFLIGGKAFKLEMFTKTSLALLIILLLIWGNVIISISFFLSSLFKRSRSSQVLVYLIVLWGVIIDSTISFIYTSSPPLAYLIWPPFAMYRAMSRLNAAAISTERAGYTLSDVKPGDDVFNFIIALVIGWAVYLLLAIYLNLTLAGEFGIRRPWHFIFTDLFKKQAEIPRELESYDESELEFEDIDVKAERNRTLQNQFPQDNPLVLRRVRKVYPSGKIAVKDVTLSIEKGTIFGLLGPNGAGKTTIISMMSGLYKMSSGFATLAGFDVTTETKQVYRNVGICPQHDILWDDLTISEHLYFYARLKGIPPSEEASVVNDIIERVALTEQKNKLSKTLSGGQKRRLSIAIAFVGNPSVVFLDEPTTGLDPEVRRTVWNIINGNKVGRTIVLTTHSMEEAEVLCNKIGIMAQGTMRCIGSQLRLKQLYGSGFLVMISCNKMYLPQAKNFIESMLPSDAQIVDNFINGASWEFKPQPGLIAYLYAQLDSLKDKYHIDDWGISQTSLDEVFLRIIGEDESGATE
ncbi:ABC transporter A family member 9 [Smittium culicis]|uniref:ABC transporter A family member 9 n=1 Tax=Smittium culicis TaxID=133412 RepID=A0A1R1XY72_9FUNG|nr:ABC transporter A family member 9 [Smittium culicis]